MERAGKAKLLLTTPGMKVYRHLVDGDALLVNRQPTLHKPGIMAHKARVLKHVREQTLRMNYANCNAYNADFDGDEMNCHFVQSELARAEAYYICNTDNQYIVPTSGNPLRGLIQDHVASAVKMTCKDTFLTKSEFQQLVYVAVTGLPGTEIVTAMENMEMPPPAIIKPRRMWTGKQVITALLTHLCRPPLPPLNLDSKTRTPPTAMGAEHNEHEVIIRDGQLLTGVLDKNAVGNVSLGLVHAVYELYGAELAGRLLNSIGRLMTYYLQDAGHTCGIEDLVLTAHSEDERSRLLNKVTSDAKAGLNNFLTDNAVDSVTASASTSAEKKLASFLHADRKNAKVKLDGAMQQVINKSASDVIKACLPNGLQTSFLRNNFSMMVMTGAKGSQVNQSQISCFLGQQALEGQRVPIMASGKSLPSFMPFDGSARAGGFVRDRFLTGVKPQEYYFHCMAGREGLVDTAVKTSRSGYLQRCLVKHLEELKVNYDMTVRDSAGKIIQFLYGEDGLDPMSAGLLGGKDNQMLFLARNNQALSHKFSLHEEFFAQGLEVDQARSYHEMVSKAKEMISKGDLLKVTKGSVLLARKKIRSEFGWERNNLSKTWHPVEVLKVREKEGSSSKKALYSITVDIKYLDHKSKDESEAIEKKVPVALKPASGGIDQVKRAPVFIFKLGLPDTAMNKLKLGSTVGACSEKMQNAITSYIENNPHGAIVSSSSGATSFSQVNSDALELLVWVKYMRSLACPGEAVGCVAAQSIGEPSTQMTLNTFHLAGHGGANVTLGIPRLREIIMTASKSLKTPTMTLPLMSDRTIESAKALARKLSRLSLYELLDHHGGIEVGEEITRDSALGAWKRKYRVRLHFQPRNKIEEVFAVVFDTIVDTVKTGFMSKLDSLIKQDQRRAGESISGKNDPLKAFRSQGGDDIPGKGRKGGSEEDGEGDNEVDEHDKKKGGGSKGKKVSFEGEDSDESDEDEEELAEEVRNNDDLGNLKLAGSGKEVIGYEDEEEGDDEDNEPKDGEDDVEGEKVDKKKKGSKSAASSSSATSSMHGEFKFSQEEGWIEMTLSYPITSRRLLMAPIAEKAAQVTMIRSTKSISNAYADTTSTSPCQVITEGVNFEAAWSLPDTLVNHNAIKSNDIYRILMTFGVEAARASIVSEISGVFAVYGIDVNPRHLSLIADFMTRDGGYTPMNRMGMMACSSPFLQMSFETTCTFLTKAAQEGLIDNHNSPSASIVLGTAPKVGTGCFDLMLPLS
jgi:DNA-directed RNA polymerase I subunit RPA1